VTTASVSTGLVIAPTRIGTVGEAFFERCPIPRGVDLVHFRQVASACPGESCEAFDTLHVDLRSESDALFAQFNKDARYEIRRALQRDKPIVECLKAPGAELVSAFCDAYDRFAAIKKLPRISRRLIQAYAAAGILRITTARDAEQQCVVWHSYLQTASRARLLHSVSSHHMSASAAERATYGRVNRFLHWQDIQWFKQLGVATYDLGGWYAGTSDAGKLTVNAFKTQFGGAKVREYNCRRALTWRGHIMLATEALLRTTSALRSYGSVERASLARSTLGAMVAVGAFNLTAYAGAAAKDVAVAYYFGRSDELDAFLIALMVYLVLVNTLGGAVAAAMLPVFIRANERQGREAGVRVLGNAVVLTCGILAILGALSVAFAPALLRVIASSFSPDKAELSRSLMFMLLPSLVLGGVTAIWGPTLSAHGRYVVAAATPIFGALATFVLLVLFGRSMGPQLLVLGVFIGSLVEVAALGMYMRVLGLAFLPRWHGFDPATRDVLRHSGTLVLAGCVSMGAIVVDQAMAASLGSGSVAALSYGVKTVTVLIGVGSVATTSVLFPQFARLSANHDYQNLRRLFRNYLCLGVAASIVAAILLAGLSEPIVRLLFQRGAFSEADTRLVSTVQSLFVIQLPFHVGGLIAVRLLSALRRNYLLVIISAITLVGDIAANYVLMQLFGVAGIALSTSVVFIGSFALLMVAVWRALPTGGVVLART
jgi:putative peptidoglycan lipid II flippase